MLASFYDAGMHQYVHDGNVLLSEQCRQSSAVTAKTCGIEDSRLRTLECGHLLFELFVQIQGSSEQGNATCTSSVLYDGIYCSLFDPGMIGQVEVIIGCHVDHVSQLPSIDIMNLPYRERAIMSNAFV